MYASSRAHGAGRATACTDSNAHSSRSHCILSFHLRATNVHEGIVTESRLRMIDLAGSEREKFTENTGPRLVEGQNINRSLSALGDVIAALGQGGGGGGGGSSGGGGRGKHGHHHRHKAHKHHIPYRNSKLTYYLQDSLGGDSKVLMFMNCSPVLYNAGETLCSLRFGQRCKAVQLGQATRHQTGGNDAEVARLRSRVAELEAKLG